MGWYDFTSERQNAVYGFLWPLVGYPIFGGHQSAPDRAQKWQKMVNNTGGGYTSQGVSSKCTKTDRNRISDS